MQGRASVHASGFSGPCTPEPFPLGVTDTTYRRPSKGDNLTLPRHLGRTSTAGVIATLALVGACRPDPFPSCSSDAIRTPNGRCNAHYYQTNYGSGGETTQALVDCRSADASAARAGGNVVAFHSVSAGGIGLRWIDDHTLEVAVPPGVSLARQEQSARYLGYPLRYVYRQLSPGEEAFQGCGLPRAQPGSN